MCLLASDCLYEGSVSVMLCLWAVEDGRLIAAWRRSRGCDGSEGELPKLTSHTRASGLKRTCGFWQWESWSSYRLLSLNTAGGSLSLGSWIRRWENSYLWCTYEESRISPRKDERAHVTTNVLPEEETGLDRLESLSNVTFKLLAYLLLAF